MIVINLKLKLANFLMTFLIDSNSSKSVALHIMHLSNIISDVASDQLFCLLPHDSSIISFCIVLLYVFLKYFLINYIFYSFLSTYHACP